MQAAPVVNPLAAKAPPLPATAKNVIFLFMHGGPSHLDTFDPKPLLGKLNGQHVPDSFGNVQLQFSKFKEVPLLASLVPLLTSLLMGADDRAMLLALPPLAVLASFALPTFQRSASALLDWFSVFFFTVGAIFLWLYYMALQIGWPAKLLANVRKLAQGYEPEFSWRSEVAGA